MDWLWPISTGRTVVDLWCFAHLSFWFVVGTTLAAMKARRLRATGICLAVTFAWEIFERVAEMRWPTVWESKESFINAWISDPATCLVALFVAFYGFDRWRPS